jgi:hypothetical protein
MPTSNDHHHGAAPPDAPDEVVSSALFLYFGTAQHRLEILEKIG